MRVLFIGNRPLIKEECQRRFYTKVLPIESRKQVIRNIKSESFNMLVSNGCPYLLPVSKLKRNETWINIHPSYLPDYKGASPIKAMDKDNVGYVGATAHYMDDGMDTGKIIAKSKLEGDFTLQERYDKSFALELEVFKEAISKLTLDG